MTTWSEFEKRTSYPALAGDIAVDVAIVGGGIAGILNAYMLSKAGKKVVLLERNELLSGATVRTTAFITKVIDTELGELASIWGDDASKKVFQSGQKAIEEYEKIIEAEGIACEFMRCDNYIYAWTRKEAKDIADEADEYRRLRIPATFEKASGLGFPNHGSLRVPGQAKFHVAKFAYALAERAAKNGAMIFEHTPVRKIQEGRLIILETPQGSITANDAIIATYQPLTNKRTRFKKGMYVSYIFEVEIPKNSFPEAIYEDNGNPYRYFRIERGDRHDTMIIGGEDHRAELGRGLAKKSFRALETYLAKLMQGRPYKITKRWSGPILEPSDGLALIGDIALHLYVATAFSGNGMTYSMISALLISDRILGKKNPWSAVYDPKRTILRPKRLAAKARDYAEEFFRGAVKNLLSR